MNLIFLWAEKKDKKVVNWKIKDDKGVTWKTPRLGLKKHGGMKDLMYLSL